MNCRPLFPLRDIGRLTNMYVTRLEFVYMVINSDGPIGDTLWSQYLCHIYNM